MANLDRRRFVLIDRTHRRYLDLASMWEVTAWHAHRLSEQRAEPRYDGVLLSRVLRALRAAISTVEPRADESLREWAQIWGAERNWTTDRDIFVRVLLEPQFQRDCRTLVALRLAEQQRGRADSTTLAALDAHNPGFRDRFALSGAARPPASTTDSPPLAPDQRRAAPPRTPRRKRPDTAVCDGVT